MTFPVGNERDEPRSLDELFEAHADRVYGFTLKRCGRPSLAEEVTAQAFEAASRRFATNRGHEVTLPWLLTVARRRLIDHWRRQSRQSDRLERLKTELLLQEGGQRSDTTRVSRALDCLPDHHRAALVLRYLEGLAVNEVADELGLSYKAAESLLSRARRAFATSYWEER